MIKRLLLTAVCFTSILLDYTSLNATKLSLSPLIPEDNPLSNRNVSTMLIDSRGYLWAGTIDGLIRYNGSEFRSFSRNDMHTLSSTVSYLYMDSKGNVWVGTEGGLSRFDLARGDFVPVNLQAEDGCLLDSKINCIQEDKTTGEIWISQKGKGMWAIDAEYRTVRHYLYDPGSDTVPPRIQNFIIDDNGRFIMSVYFQGIWVADREFSLMQPVNVPGFDFSKDNVVALSFDNRNVLHLASSKYGLCELFLPGSRARQIEPLRNKEYPTNLFIANSGKVYMTTSLGIHVYDPSASDVSVLDCANSYGSHGNKVICMAVDGRENMLVALSSGNIYFSAYRQFVSRFPELADGTSLDMNYVNSFAEDDRGNIWISTDGLGILKYDPQTGILERKRFRSVPDQCFYINWNDGRLYVSASSSLYIIDPSTGDVIHNNPEMLGALSLVDRPIYPIICVQDRMFFGTALGIVTYNTADRTFSHLPGSEEFNVNVIVRDGSSVWIATYAHGLVKYDMEQCCIRHYPNEAEIRKLTGTRINCLHMDSRGRIWVGTNESGLVIIRPDGNFSHIDCESSFGRLASGNIKCIQEDSMGTLWVATENGLTSISSDMKVFEHYTVTDGLLDNTFLKNSGMTSRDGTLFFGSKNGFISFKGEDVVNKDGFVPGLYIENLLINGKNPEQLEISELTCRNLDVVEHFVLKHNQNNLTFSFARPSFPTSSDGYISCKLEDIEKSWTRLGQSNSVTYKDLPPGHYRLLIRSCGIDGSVEVARSPLSFTIRRPAAGSIVAIILYCLIISGICVFAAGKIWIRFKQKEELRRKEFIEKQIALTPERKMLRAAQIGQSPQYILSPNLSDKDRAFVSKIDAEIERHIGDSELSYGIVADHICMGKQNMNLRFKSLMGMTVNDYIRIFRLFAAVRLLSNDQFRVNEVCFQVGFNTPSYFAKCFKMTFGMLPGEYREL